MTNPFNQKNGEGFSAFPVRKSLFSVSLKSDLAPDLCIVTAGTLRETVAGLEVFFYLDTEIIADLAFIFPGFFNNVSYTAKFSVIHLFPPLDTFFRYV